jgi:hypothetical protein
MYNLNYISLPKVNAQLNNIGFKFIEDLKWSLICIN